MLRELYRMPQGLLALEAHQLESALGGPTLIHLPGQREPALFVAVLLHGNETVGWEAVRRLLNRYRLGDGFDLPRALSLFIGNVEAAAAGVRRLEGQPDYNRVWPGSEEPSTPEHEMTRRVVQRMGDRGVFASVDVHNNTGTNPHYACVNRLDHRFLHLATLFGRTVVYFLRPRGVLSMAMAGLCPSVTLECGKVGQAHGTDHAETYLEACLHLAEHPLHEVAAHDIDLFHTVAQVKVPGDVDFRVGDGSADLVFSPEMDRFNFHELARGTALGSVAPHCDFCLEVRDESGRDVAHRYFEIAEGELRFKLPVMPSMLTLNEQVIRQDCLCYLMERYNDRQPHKGLD
jgi:succinylglutamate desuccinylase